MLPLRGHYPCYLASLCRLVECIWPQPISPHALGRAAGERGRRPQFMLRMNPNAAATEGQWIAVATMLVSPLRENGQVRLGTDAKPAAAGHSLQARHAPFVSWARGGRDDVWSCFEWKSSAGSAAVRPHVCVTHPEPGRSLVCVARQQVARAAGYAGEISDATDGDAQALAQAHGKAGLKEPQLL